MAAATKPNVNTITVTRTTMTKVTTCSIRIGIGNASLRSFGLSAYKVTHIPTGRLEVKEKIAVSCPPRRRQGIGSGPEFDPLETEPSENPAPARTNSTQKRRKSKPFPHKWPLFLPL